MWTRLKTSFRPKPRVQIFFFTNSMSSIIDREQVSKLSNKFKLVKKMMQWNKFIASLFLNRFKMSERWCITMHSAQCRYKIYLHLKRKLRTMVIQVWNKITGFFMKKLKKFDFFDFRSQKIIISYQSRLNFWKTCEDSKK